MQVSDVHGREDFVRFVEEMSRSREKHAETFANPDLAGFLDAVARWTEGMERVYRNTGREMPKDIDWQMIATLFHMGRIYE